MRIPVPHSDGLPLVTIILFTPKGEVSATVDDRHWWVDIPLPDGVEEDEVDVYSCFLGADHRPPFGCGPALVKAATRKPETCSGSGRRACSSRRARSGCVCPRARDGSGDCAGSDCRARSGR